MNLATLDVTNGSLETVIIDPKEILGILDLRSVGYYKINQRKLQQNLSRYYKCEQFDKYIKEGEGRKEGKVSMVRTR